MMAQRRRVAAGFLTFRRVRNNIEYLLLQASNGEHHWSPPKGHMEAGESELETAYRETEEEAGLKKDDLVLLDKFKRELHYEAFKKPKRVVYWLSQLKNPEIPVVISHEHQDFKWLDKDKAVEYARYPDIQQVIREAHQFISENE